MHGLRTRLVSRALGVVAARSRLQTDGRLVVLTYDDGPDPVHTAQVMGALDAHHATATFFVLLTRARRAPALLAELRAAGHEIALHGPDHRALSDFGRRDGMRRMLDAKAELEDLAQTPVRHYRPPYGMLTGAGATAVRVAGLRTLLWNHDFHDWTDATEQERIAAATDGLRAGDVVLAHDSHATHEDGAADGVGPDIDRAGLSRAVLTRIEAMGLRAASAAHLSADRSGTRSD